MSKACCLPIMSFLRRFGFISRNKKAGKRPENYLTPYEMEMVPMMLKELGIQNPRFFENVSFRWFKEAMASARDTTTDPSSSNCGTQLQPPVTINEFETEGHALEELIRLVSKILMEKGTFDDECENHINNYRRKREQWRCTNAAATATATLAAPTLLRTRSFSAAVAAPPISSSRLNGKANYQDEFSRKTSFWSPAQKEERTKAAQQTDNLFMQLGEVLAHQYQCAARMDKDGNVHERELKLLIWRHFVQMLVAILTDRVRFP